MDKTFIPKIDLPKSITSSKIDNFNLQPIRLSAVTTPKSAFQNFGEVMSDIVKKVDNEAKRPDKVMAEAMVNPNMDVHDVMIAVNQAELTLTIATQSATKIIQGYEKIISMQV